MKNPKPNVAFSSFFSLHFSSASIGSLKPPRSPTKHCSPCATLNLKLLLSRVNFSHPPQIVALVFILLLVQPNYVTHSTKMSPALNLAKGVEEFAAELYENIRADAGQDENIILSPLSIQLALGLALMGAEGKTAQEMLTGMKLAGSNREAVANAFEEFLLPLKDSPMLKIANKVYVKNAYHIKATFNELATKKFQSETEVLNFGDATNSANTINSWVESKTNQLIKDLVSADALTADTRLVLVNAIYFKGFWTHQFPVHATTKEPFFNTEEDSVQVDMMHLEEKLPYVELPDLDAKAIQLPYKDSDMSMLIVLPNLRTGLAALDAKLKTTDLQSITQKMSANEKVLVSLPKFKVEFEKSLPSILSKMGMPTMFTDGADFSSMLDEDESLYVSEVIHKAFIEVNEEGAEAAAATGMMMAMMCMIVGPQTTFTADHGFKYYIMHQHQPVFTGDFVRSS